MAKRKYHWRKGNYFSRRSACSHGHEYTPETMLWYTRPDGYKTRRCLICEGRLKPQKPVDTPKKPPVADKLESKVDRMLKLASKIIPRGRIEFIERRAIS
jgi:hypothetical protein